MNTKAIFGSSAIYVIIASTLISLAILIITTSPKMVEALNESFTNSFNLEDCNFSTTGTNPYFILQPGYHLVFAGTEDGEPLNVTVTVTNETKVVGDGIVTRAVEERVVNSETHELKELT